MQDKSDNLQFIQDGIINAIYDLTSSKAAIQSYFEVDLGELNYVNSRTDLFKKNHPKQTLPGSYSDLELKTWTYHKQVGISVPGLIILNELKIGQYATIDQVVADYAVLLPRLLKKGYFLYGTKTANLFMSLIPSIEHNEYEFFFGAKLCYVSRKLSLIDPFLKFQLQKFLDAGKSLIDFKRFVKLCLREYANYFNLRKEAIETFEEWIVELETKGLGGTTRPLQGITWTGSKVDLIKFVYASFKLKYIDKGDGSVTKLTKNILHYFGQEFKNNDNTLSNNLKQKQNWGGHPEDFFDKLKDCFNEYQRDPHCFKRK